MCVKHTYITACFSADSLHLRFILTHMKHAFIVHAVQGGNKASRPIPLQRTTVLQNCTNVNTKPTADVASHAEAFTSQGHAKQLSAQVCDLPAALGTLSTSSDSHMKENQGELGDTERMPLQNVPAVAQNCSGSFSPEHRDCYSRGNEVAEHPMYEDCGVQHLQQSDSLRSSQRIDQGDAEQVSLSLECESQAVVSGLQVAVRTSSQHMQVATCVSSAAETGQESDHHFEAQRTAAAVSTDSPVRRTSSANVTTTRPVTPASPAV